MSNSIGLVKFQSDNTIMYSEYDGIIDTMRPKLFNTFEEMDNCWKRDQNLVFGCDCESEEIEIFSGRDFYWSGKACRKCMEICENSAPEASDIKEGEPDWVKYYYMKINILEHLKSPIYFEEERIIGAKIDYERLSPPHIQDLKDINNWSNNKWGSYYYRQAIFNLLSLELAAGASKVRCKNWFSILAQIDACIFDGESNPNNPQEAVINFAIARDFNMDRYENWPKPYESNIPATILYILMTGKKDVVLENSSLHDAKHWLNLYQAILQHDEEKVKENSIALADWWFKEYEANDTPVYDPENFPCFEPDCNAILSIALHKEKLKIDFEEEKYKNFYIAALM